MTQESFGRREVKIIDYCGNQVELTHERWQHIISEHPEVRGFKNRLLEILGAPDLVKRSKRDKDVLLYYHWYPDIFGGKYLLVVVKIQRRPFLLTCYATDKIKEGDVIWQRS